MKFTLGPASQSAPHKSQPERPSHQDSPGCSRIYGIPPTPHPDEVGSQSDHSHKYWAHPVYWEMQEYYLSHSAYGNHSFYLQKMDPGLSQDEYSEIIPFPDLRMIGREYCLQMKNGLNSSCAKSLPLAIWLQIQADLCASSSSEINKSKNYY